MSPRIKTASRAQILRAVRTLLADGKPRTARALVEELARMDLLTDKTAVNSVLCIEGRRHFVRDNTNFTYALLSTSVAQPGLQNNKVVRPSVVLPTTEGKTSVKSGGEKNAARSGAGARGTPVTNVPAPRPTIDVTNLPPSVPEDFSRSVSLLSAALSDEIAAVRKTGGQKTYLSDGRYIGTSDGHYVYSFSADLELRFPDDTPVDLEYRGTKHAGTVHSIAGFDIVLSIDEHIGDSIATAVLYTAPWFLLEELKRRLSGAQNSERANRALACRLLSRGEGIEQPQNTGNARYLLDRIEGRTGASIALNAEQLQSVAAGKCSDLWWSGSREEGKALGEGIETLSTPGAKQRCQCHASA